ncbi:hypothetical protein ABZT08_15975 [Streptomyces sp. NPDC005526]|uniref:hypothetical protein n=1 Tax=Streptomyces sp. NPDC005526 TaxID=3156885 RepID=UPI0033BAE971
MKRRTITALGAVGFTATVLISTPAVATESPQPGSFKISAAGGASCIATPQNPHRSSGQPDGRILFKTRVTCQSTYPSVTVHINGRLEMGPRMGPRPVMATSSQTQVIKSGKTATFYTPLEGGKQVRKAGSYTGVINGQITAPTPGNIDTGISQTVYVK